MPTDIPAYALPKQNRQVLPQPRTRLPGGLMRLPFLMH